MYNKFTEAQLTIDPNDSSNPWDGTVNKDNYPQMSSSLANFRIDSDETIEEVQKDDDGMATFFNVLL